MWSVAQAYVYLLLSVECGAGDTAHTFKLTLGNNTHTHTQHTVALKTIVT